MKKLLTTSSIFPLLVAVVVLVVPVSFAHAGIGEFFYNKIVIGFFGWILGMTGSVLDYAVNTYVIGFGKQFVEGFGSMVDTTWATVRDLFNLTFIFGLVYIGFKMILRTDDGQTKRWLVYLILAALMVNFSLFISKFVIDFSNILAVEIINLGEENDIFSLDPVAGSNKVLISQSMQQNLGVVTATGLPDVSETSPDITFATIFGTMLVFLVASFVFLSAGIMLIIRGAVLIVIMILSPFLFLGMVLPMFKSQSSKLWRALLSRSFFAPIYITFLYITIGTAQAYRNSLGEIPKFSEAFQGSEGTDAVAANAGAFGPFILITALLVISLVVAQKLGAEGASGAMRIGNNMRRSAQRNLVNRPSRYVGRKAKDTALYAPRRGARLVSNVAGKGLNRGLSKLQQTKGNGVVAKATRAIARSNPVQEVVGGSAAAMTNAKFGKKRSREEERKMKNQTNRKADQAMKQEENLAVLGDVSSSTDDLNKAMEELATTMRKMSSEELSNKSTKELTDNNVAMNLTDNNIESLEKSGKFTGDEAQAIKDARREAQINMAYTGTATVQDSTVAPALRVSTNAEMRTASSAPGATPAQQRAHENRDKIRARLVSKSSSAAEMPTEVFQNPDMYDHISPKTVESKLANVTNADRNKMRDALLTNQGITPPPAGTAAAPPPGTPWETWHNRSAEGARFFS